MRMTVPLSLSDNYFVTGIGCDLTSTLCLIIGGQRYHILLVRDQSVTEKAKTLFSLTCL